MIRAVSKKNGICVVMPLWAVAIWKWLEGSGNGGLSSLSGLYMGRIPRRDSVKPTEGKDFCS